MKEIKICLVTTFYPPYHSGGCGLHVYHLANLLAEAGHRVEVVCSGEAHAYKINRRRPGRYPHHPGVRVHRLRSGAGKLEPLFTYLFGFPLLLRRQLGAILKKDFDVIHYHNISLFGGISILGWGRAIKLFTLHTYWLLCPTHYLWKKRREVCRRKECGRCLFSYRRPPQLWRYPGSWKRFLGEVDSLIMPCRFMLDLHREEGFEGRMDCLPYFVFPVPAAPDPAREEKFRRYRPFFLFVARMESYKGPEVIISAFKKKRGGSKLIMVGSGTQSEHCRKLAAGDERIQFLEYVAPEELNWFYQNAIALLAPSVWPEMGNLTVLQAASCGTPAIAAARGCLPEMVEEHGSGIMFGTEGELIRALERMEEADERAKYVPRARDAYQRNYTPEKFLTGYLELIREIASKKNRGH